jgi:CHASE2 domain-containing sensor protein
MGATNPELDLRAVPLQFQVDGYPVPSLAWAVARMADPPLEGELAPYLNEPSSRFTILLGSDDFQGYTITDDELLSRKFSPETVRGRVVVIGSGDDQVFPTAFGPLQSHVLHAGYIEALMDRHTLQKIPEWITFVVAMLFWYLVESRPFLKAMRVFVIETVTLLVANLVFVRLLSLYGDFSTISIAGFFVWLFTVIRETPQMEKWTRTHC